MEGEKKFNEVSMRFLVSALIVIFNFSSCSAFSSKRHSSVDMNQMQTDSVMRAAIGDSIYAIICYAKTIKAEEIILAPDTISPVVNKPTIVKKQYIPLVKFIISDPQVYGGDKEVYGQVMPCFKLTFIKSNQQCTTCFDFGLKKWILYNADGKAIRQFDLSSDNMLRFANKLFPDNTLFKNQINVEKR